MDTAGGTPARMSADELARRSGTSREHVEELVRIGVLEPAEDSTFDWIDVQRVSIVAAYAAGGIGLDDLAAALRDGNMTFAYSASIYPPPSAITDDTVAGVAADGDASTELMRDLYLGFGLPIPDERGQLTRDEADALRAFLDGWRESQLAPDAAVRAARIAGLAVHRLTDGWVDLFLDTVAMRPEERLARRVEELGSEFFQPAARVAASLMPVVAWLVRRHLERALNRVNVEFLEYALAQRGLRSAGHRLPVIAFADFSGFTALTERAGDAAAAANAVQLGDLAVQASAGRGGRLVKQLGDGVLLVFDHARGAVDAIRDLRHLARAADLPAVHVGLAAGPVIQRDGDLYGRTVNLAARISAAATAGEVLANETLAAQLPGDFTVAGAQPLKGFEGSVELFRLVSEEA